MAQINIPSDWPTPKFTFGQSVRARKRTDYVIGIEYLSRNCYPVVAEELPPGWYYIIQVQGSLEILNQHETDVAALVLEAC
jgi:hypothetical protein